MQKKYRKLTQKRLNKTYQSYQGAADDAKVTKVTAMKIIKKEAQEAPTPLQVTIYKMQNGVYQHPIIVHVDTTSARTIEGMENQALIVAIQFPNGNALKQEVIVNKLLYNEKAETIAQVLMAEVVGAGFVLDERDVVIIDDAKELRKPIPAVSKNVKIQLCLWHLRNRLNIRFSTSLTAEEHVDESDIDVRYVFKGLIMDIAGAKNQSERSASIKRLISMRSSLLKGMWPFWKRFKTDLDAGFYHTLDEQPFWEIYHKYEGLDIRNNNLAEAQCHRVQTLRKGANGFKIQDDTQDRFNSFFLGDRTDAKIEKLTRKIPEFKPTYCWNIPLQLGALDLVDQVRFTKVHQIPGFVLEEAAKRFHRIGVKQFSFLPSAVPSFAREIEAVVEELFAKLNIPYVAENFEPLSLSHIRKHRFPALSTEVVTEDKNLMAFKEALERTQQITRRYCSNYVIQPYKVAVEIISAMTGMNLRPYYQILLSQGFINNHCPRKWNYGRRRKKLQIQLEEGQNADGVEFRENGTIAFITNPNTAAAKMLISNSGLDKPPVPESFIHMEALRRNRRFTGRNAVKIRDGIYDSDLLALLFRFLRLTDVSLHQNGKDMPLGIKIGECMVVVSPMVIIGTKAEETRLDVPLLTELNTNYFLKRDYKKARFSLAQWNLKKRIETLKTVAKPTGQLTLFGNPFYSKRFSLVDWSRRKNSS
jgi:hypothetical protein